MIDILRVSYSMETMKKIIWSKRFRNYVYLLLFLIICFLFFSWYHSYVTKTISQTREEYFVEILQQKNAKVGAEIGVFEGDFALWMLSKWTKCEKYYLIDPWTVQKNYNEFPNKRMEEKDLIFNIASKKLEKWKNKTEFLRMRSEDAASKIEDGSLDFVYIDGRHDYCACKLDIEMYWPKLRRGGVLSGHDYILWGFFVPVRVVEWVVWMGWDSDWTSCENGTHQSGNVIRAVEEFAQKNNLKLLITNELLGSWVIEKP